MAREAWTWPEWNKKWAAWETQGEAKTEYRKTRRRGVSVANGSRPVAAAERQD